MRALLIAVAALVAAAPAAAGGWATAGLAPPPKGIGPGDTWKAEVTVLQHGRTPLQGVVPVVEIRQGGKVHSFAARPTKEPGVYVADVKFPSGGEWRYVVKDGFGGTHGFAPVQVGSTGAEATSPTRWTLAVLLGALALVAAFLLLRRARTAPAPVAQQ